MTRDALRRGAVVLCGGRSDRMGRDKALLDFAGEPLLVRVVRLTREATHGEVVVVARQGQSLPPLPAFARVVHDDADGLGPLAGLAKGLAESRADAVFATACDAPFVVPGVVALLFEQLGDADAAAVSTAGRPEPLCAVYRTRLAVRAADLLAAGERRAGALLGAVPWNPVGADALQAVDPEGLSLRDCDTPSELEAARRAAEV